MSGVYGALCTSCATRKRRELADAPRTTVPVRLAPTEAPVPGKETRADQTRELLRLAGEVDKQQRNVDVARERLRKALGDLKQTEARYEAYLRGLLPADKSVAS